MLTLTEDRWLGERFGHPVFSADLGTAPGAAEPADELAHGLARIPPGPATFQAKAGVAEVAELRRLEASGFGVVCVAVELSRALGNEDSSPRRSSAIEVDYADAERDAAIVGISGRSLTMTRFHLDPEVDPEVARRIKEDWAANCLAGDRGELTLVSRGSRGATGFCAGVARSRNGEPALAIDLIAVDPDHQRTGSGRALIERFFAEAHQRGYRRVTVGTQLANQRSLGFYASCGFAVSGASFDLHAHRWSATVASA